MQPAASGRSERPKYDQFIKWMLTQAHDAFLRLVAPELTWVSERSPVLPSPSREADVVWEVMRPSGGRGLFHMELQIKPASDIGERMADYDIRLWMRDHLPVRSLVVFLREAPSTPESPFVIPWEENDESMRFRFEVLRLWEVPQDAVLSSPDYTLWPLAGLMGGATPENTVEVAERLASLPVAQQECSDLIGILVGLAGVRGSRDVIFQAIRRNPMIDDLLKESSTIQAFYEEGIEAGRAVGEREMVRLALEGRFGALPQDVLAALATANEATLRSIIGRIATITLDEARTELNAAQAK